MKINKPRFTELWFLRFVTLQDGETVHNAFFDRGFETRTN